MTSNRDISGLKIRLVFVVFALLLFAHLAEASDAVVMYRSNSGSCAPKIDCPKVRFWNSTGSGSWGPEIELQDSGANVRYAVIRQAPVATKIVGVVQSAGASATLTGYVCMSHCDNVSNWKITNSVATVNGNDRAFDIMFDSHGNALLVYDDGGNTSQDLAYKILPMANTSFDNLTQYYIDDAGHGTATTYNWVRMDPSPDKCEVLLTAEDQTNNDVNAWVWDGSSWSNQTEITADFPSPSGDEALAVRYALNDTIGMVVAANDSNGTVNYKYWNGASWSSVYSFYVNTSDTISWINIEPDPQTDDLQAIMIDDSAALHTAYWDGSNWYVTSNIDADVDNGGNTRVADFDWEQTGSTGRLVWDTDQNSPGDRLSQRECNPQCTANTTNITSYDRTGNFLTIIRNPTVTDQVKLLSVRLNSQDNIGSFSFNGTGYYNYGDTVISSDGQTGFEVETIYFQLSTTIPVINCTVITESGEYAMFTNLFGAPNNASPLTDTVCVKIAASDVDFDCNGYNITNNGTGGITFGVLLNGSLENVTVRNCPSISEYMWNVYVYDSNDSVITNTTAHSGSQGGITVYGNSDNNVLSDNTAYNNSNYGFLLNFATNTNVTGNTANNNSDGFYLSFGSGTRLTDNTAFENSQNGIYMRNSDNLALTNDHLYNNALDLHLNATSGSRTVNISGVIFDNPVGNYQYYTNLSVDDVISSDSVYTLDWSSQPAALPAAYSSFESKYVNITNITGTVSLDSIVWHWLDSESAAYNENYLELWKYNSSANWTKQTAATLNTAANTLSMTSMSPASVYAILYLTPVYPNITIESPVNTTYAVSNIDLNYTVWDTVAGIDSCWYYLNGAGPTALPGCANTTLALADGYYNLTVYVNNTIGSINSSTVFFTVDATPPTITIQSPTNTTYNISNIDLNYTVADNIAVDSCWYYLNGAGPTALASCTNTSLALADGSYNLTVFVNDTAGNTNSSTVFFTVDATPPSLTVQSPMNITYNTSSIPVNYIASDTNLDNCSVYFDGLKLPVTNCANVTSLGATEGPHNVTVVVNDTAGNVNSTTIYFLVDLTPPTITIQSPINTTYNISDIDLNYTVGDNFAVDSCWYYLNGAGPTALPGCGNTTLTSLADGFYTLTVYVNDTGGNQNSSTVSFTVDTTPPTVVISSPINTTYNITWIPLTYIVSDNIAVDTCWVVIDSFAPVNLPGCVNASLGAVGLGDGPHNVTVYVNDTVGHVNSSTVYFTVDLTPPTITIESPINTTYNTSDIDLNYTVADNIAVDSCWYYLNGTGPTALPGCGNTTLTSLADGFYTLTVYVNDTGGNQNSSTVSFTVDTTPPTLTFQSPMNITYGVLSIDLNYTVSDNIAVDTCWYYTDLAGPLPLPGCANITLNFTTDGSHYVTVYVNDTAGNQYSPIVFFSIDTTPPAISIQNPINTTYGTGNIDVNYTVSDPNLDSCWYYLNGAGPTALPGCGNTTLSSLGDGFYNLTIFVNDTLGNTNSSSVYFTVDTTFPVISIQSPTNTTYNISTIDLNYTTSNGNIDTCWYYLDGAYQGVLASCTNTTLPGLSDGSHNVSVYVNDTANNTAFALVYFTVDTTPPTVTIQSPTNTTYTVSSVDLNYTVADNLALNSCWYTLDGGAATPLPGCANGSLGPLSNGQHNVTVFADDTGGNQNSSTVFFTINVTISPPPPGDGNGDGSKMLDVVWEQICPDDEIVVNVTYKFEPVSGVEVRIIKYTTFSNLVDVVDTDDDGQITFAPSSEGEYRFYFSKSGYRYEEDPLVIQYTFCEPVCESDTDCPSDQYCEDGICESIQCECGYIEEHECVEYECCADEDCPEGHTCESNECVPECETDNDCPDDEYCSDGQCLPVEPEECGFIANHAWYDYECCEDTDCPEGYECEDHSCTEIPCATHQDCDEGEICDGEDCVPADYGIDAPDEVPKGEDVDVGVSANDRPVKGINVEVTSPDGIFRIYITDGDGRIVFTADQEGEYTIRLLKPGVGEDAVNVRPPLDIWTLLCWLAVILLPLILLFIYYLRGLYTIYFQTGVLGTRTIALSPGLLKEFGLKSGDRVILTLNKKESAAVIGAAPSELIRDKSPAKGQGRYILAGESVVKDLGIKLGDYRDTKGAGYEKYTRIFGLKIKKK